MRPGYFHHAYGLRVASPFPLPALPRMGGVAPADGVLFVRLTEAPLAEALSARMDLQPYSLVDCDGVPVESEMGAAGDHLIRYGHDARFHLSADGSLLRCSLDGTGWEAGLAGSVLGHVSALDGYVVLDGTATSSAGVAVALLGEPERVAGIAAALLERGHALHSRGLIALSCDAVRVTTHPGAGAPKLARAMPLAAVVFVEPGAGDGSWLVPPEDFIAQLLRAWVVPHARLEQAEHRAAAFEDLVCGTPVYTLLAGGETPRAASLVDSLTSRPPRPSPPPTSTSRSPTSA